MQRFARLGRNVWVLARGYWGSDERWWAWGLLAAVIASNLGYVYVAVLLNGAYGGMYNGLQEKSSPAFYAALVTFIELALASIAVQVVRIFLQQVLEIRWRRWLT
jgi:putative ATP-binding cassette transporter